MAIEFLASGYLSEFQKLMTDASNYLEASNYDASLDRLAQASSYIMSEEEEESGETGDSSPSTPRKRASSLEREVSERRAWFEYISGRAHRGRGDLDVDQKCFEVCICIIFSVVLHNIL